MLQNYIYCFFLRFNQSSGCGVSRVVKKGTHVWLWRHSDSREGGVSSKHSPCSQKENTWSKYEEMELAEIVVWSLSWELLCKYGRFIYLVLYSFRPDLSSFHVTNTKSIEFLWEMLCICERMIHFFFFCTLGRYYFNFNLFMGKPRHEIFLILFWLFPYFGSLWNSAFHCSSDFIVKWFILFVIND